MGSGSSKPPPKTSNPTNTGRKAQNTGSNQQRISEGQSSSQGLTGSGQASASQQVEAAGNSKIPQGTKQEGAPDKTSSGKEGSSPGQRNQGQDLTGQQRSGQGGQQRSGPGGQQATERMEAAGGQRNNAAEQSAGVVSHRVLVGGFCSCTQNLVLREKLIPKNLSEDRICSCIQNMFREN